MPAIVIETMAGQHIYDVLSKAVENAPARFEFNGMAFETRAGETLGDARARFQAEHNFEVLTPAQGVVNAKRHLEETERRHAEAIAAAGVATEVEMRDAEVPWPKTIEQLTEYVQALVDRPHDYGTCVYAMSHAAVAAFRFVASKLGTTGFQVSCADMDILSHTRDFKWGRILNYDNLLYPQSCDDEHFPTWRALLANDEIRSELAKRAKENLAESPDAHPDVLSHWKMLAEDEALTHHP